MIWVLRSEHRQLTGLTRSSEMEGCEVAVLGYPQTPILLERENGILDALEENAPNAEVVANQPAIDTTEVWMLWRPSFRLIPM